MERSWTIDRSRISFDQPPNPKIRVRWAMMSKAATCDCPVPAWRAGPDGVQERVDLSAVSSCRTVHLVGFDVLDG